jgi:endonuclease/exonuclease/phosphatase family metal-dependent hydrolase
MESIVTSRALRGVLLLFASVAAACGDDAAPPSDTVASDNTTKPPVASAPTGNEPAAPAPAPAATAPKVDGTFTFVSYNVGGLADFISAGSPSETTPLISPMLNPFDVVVVQEDFEYHKKLVSQLTFPFQVKPGGASFPKVYGDGLATFSRFQTGEVTKEQWDDCNGTTGSKNDCLAEKGFRCVMITLEAGVDVEVCNLHMDAGRGADDAKTRDKQSVQFAAYLTEHASTHAVIAAGDTNMKAEDEPSFLKLVALTSLRDTCRELSCPQPALHDRVFVRDAPNLKLTASSWEELTTFVDANGKALSDHDPVSVKISWTKQ